MFCTKCGTEINSSSIFCKNCGNKIKSKNNTTEVNTKSLGSTNGNGSGLGESSIIPNEIEGWSWGGFLMGWIWSIGNNTWIGLLATAPCLGFIMNIILGMKGREWAWKNKKWDSVEHFKKIQKKWAIWGLFLGIGIIPLLGIVSVAILSTINPIEQANKARDARVMNDSAEVLNAFERYYAVNDQYPWQQNKNSNTSQLVDINNAGWMDLVFSSGELEGSFREKLSNLDDKYTLYSNGIDTYVCFNPKSDDKINTAKRRCATDPKITNTSLCLDGNEQVCFPDLGY